jgi:hypothetical protein
LVDSRDIAEQLQEASEAYNDRFRKIAAIYIGIIAMLLSIASLGGQDAQEARINANIHASDTYALYQAKYSRQVMFQISAQELEVLVIGLNLSSDQLGKVMGHIDRYLETAKRYESEPETGDGKRELTNKAKEYETLRDKAAAQAPNFHHAEALYQIAIVLGSIAIVVVSRWLLILSAILSTVALVLTVNGYLLLVPILG